MVAVLLMMLKFRLGSFRNRKNKFRSRKLQEAYFFRWKFVLRGSCGLV